MSLLKNKTLQAFFLLKIIGLDPVIYTPGGTDMKKILIALIILGTICANTFAQEYDVVEVGEESKIAFTNEAYLTVGTPSFVGLFDQNYYYYY